MKTIEQALKNEYREALSKCKFSDKRRLYKLYEAPKRTTVSRKIIISYAVLAAAIMLLLLTGAAAAYTLYDAVLEEWNTTPEEFTTGSFPIEVNKYGETIGNMFDGVDLYKVGRHDSTIDMTGYVYWVDFNNLVERSNPNNENTLRNWVYVYNIDGDEIIGVFVEGGEHGFITNEELESPDIAARLRNGDDAEEYIKMAEERLAEKTK